MSVYKEENIIATTPNARRYEVLNGQVMVYELIGVHQADIDAWQQLSLDDLENTEQLRDYVIVDLSRSDFTRYLESTSKALASMDNFRGERYVAMVTPDTVTSKLLRPLIPSTIKSLNPDAKWKLFTSLEDAIRDMEIQITAKQR